MSNLGGREIYKYAWRTELLKKKIRSGGELTTTCGTAIYLVPDSSLIISLDLQSETRGLRISDTLGRKWKFNQIKKTSEFGGGRSGTAREDAALSTLRSQLIDLSPPIDLNVCDITHSVCDVVSTPGTPKSDFHFIDCESKPCVWISHKHGSAPRDFQQWGGISQRREPEIWSHPETQSFISTLWDMHPDGVFPRATSLSRPILDRRLQNLSVYGNEFGDELSENNVSLLAQGSVLLSPTETPSYELKSSHIHFNGDPMSTEYSPVFLATYKGDRSNAGLEGCRISISPAGGRKSITI